MAMNIRKAEAEDIPEILSLFNANTAPPKSAYHFQWWNRIPSVTFCATQGERIVGMFVVLRRKLINNLSCGVLMGLVVEKEWRGRGLFKDLGDLAMNYFEDIDLFCCLTNQIGEKALKKNFDFRTIDTIETMLLPIAANTDCPEYVNTPITADTRFTNFRIRKNDTVMFSADGEFRRWRFASHPRFSYRMIRADSDEFVVMNTYRDEETNIRYGDIADFESKALEEGRLIPLFNCASVSLKKDVDMVTIQAVPNSLLHGVAKKMGFRESDIRHYFSIKVKEPHNEYLYDSSKWLLKWGDYLR